MLPDMVGEELRSLAGTGRKVEMKSFSTHVKDPSAVARFRESIIVVTCRNNNEAERLHLPSRTRGVLPDRGD